MGVNNIPEYGFQHQQGNIEFTINLSQMPILNTSNTYIFYVVDSVDQFFTKDTIISLNKVGPTEKDNQTFSRLVNYATEERLLEDEFLVKRVDDNYDQQGGNSRYFHYRGNNLFISTDFPIIIIDKVQNNFLMTVLPVENYRNLHFLIKHDVHSGNVTSILDRRSLINLLPQIYSILNWEPISNIVNYPLNPNYLQTL